MHPFQTAIEARDIPAVVQLLAPDVTFRSPIVFAEYRGRDAVEPILHAIAEVFEDFRYTRSIGSPDGRDHALVFSAVVGRREVEGCDFIHVDDAGMVDELVVMVRPASAVVALAEAMGDRLQDAPPTRRR
ncbi:MAG TPA: nuclear transport factor 2 family protein [Marmoricola sp.]|nr:nuclear transport factor 2 family protein [Marmoricola sp.]